MGRKVLVLLTCDGDLESGLNQLSTVVDKKEAYGVEHCRAPWSSDWVRHVELLNMKWR